MAQHARSVPQPAKHPLRSLSVPTFGMGTSHSAPYTSPTTDGKVLGSLTGCMDSCTSRLQGTAPPQFCAGRKEKSLKDAPARIKEEFCPRSFADIHKFGCIYDCSTISLTETQVSSPPPSPSRFFFLASQPVCNCSALKLWGASCSQLPKGVGEIAAGPETSANPKSYRNTLL